MRIPMACSIIIAIVLSCTIVAQEPESGRGQVTFRHTDNEVMISVGNTSIANYVFNDPEIPRPYFAHVKTLDGVQVTRNHPPRPGKDRRDHRTMHPGIWMAFGDLDGSDFWRNKAHVKHIRFHGEPIADGTTDSFVEEKHYLRSDGSLICSETFHLSVHVRPNSLPSPSGYMLVWDSIFRSDESFFFGDQEEMGLGLRVATPISEVNGGELSDSSGRIGAKQIWSHPARWCDYSGVMGDQKLGMTLMCHPENFRHSWMHARDYGFVAANPFGRNAMKKGEPSKVTVKPGETLRLRYAILVHSANIEKSSDIEPCYEEYLSLETTGND